MMLFTDEYRTIAERSQGNFRDRGSRFLSFAIPVKSEAEVKAELERMRKEYYDATHHCYAYLLGFDKSTYRVNDDGEPSGSAGRPIYGQILSNDLTNILVVVIRYYGGTNLGIPGLINAYKTAALEAIGNASVITCVVKEIYALEFSYEQLNDVMKIVKDELLEVINNDFGMKCVMQVAVRFGRADHVMGRLQKVNNLTYKRLSTI